MLFSIVKLKFFWVIICHRLYLFDFRKNLKFLLNIYWNSFICYGLSCTCCSLFNIIKIQHYYNVQFISGHGDFAKYPNRIGIKISPNSECGDKQTSTHSNFRIVQCVNLYYKNTIFNYLTLFIPVSLKDNAHC